MEILVLYVISVGLSVFLAKKKNRNIYLWGAFSIIFLIIAPIILAILPRVRSDNEEQKELEETPKQPASAMKKFGLYAACFTVIFAVLGNMTYEDKIKNDDILKDPIYVTANIGTIEEKKKFKKGVAIKSYKINYEYNDSGKKYSSSFTVSDDFFGDYKNKTTVDVVYLKSNPALSKLKSALGMQMDTSAWIALIGKLFLFCLIMSLLPFGIFAYKLGWIKAK